MDVFTTIATYVAATIASILVFAVLKRQGARHVLPLPPGPRPLPLIGNLLDIPQEKEWLTYQSWTKQYGDVVYIEALGQKIVILGSTASVNDLMERRSTVYSDRPCGVMSNELMRLDWLLSMMPYGETWRRGRKLLHAHVHRDVAPQYHPVQIETARRFVKEILAVKQEKDALSDLVRSNFSRSIIKIVYGIDVKSIESEFISLPEKVLQNLSEGATPGRFLVDSLPILRHIPAWVPGAEFQRYARQARRDNRLMRDKPIEEVQAQMAHGTAPHSMAQTMLQQDMALPSEESQFDMIKDITAVAYIAGTDTIVTTAMSFFLAMLVYPEVQAKAQAEVDRVVGQDRLPEIDDEEHMPYVHSVASECLRWLPALPMAIAHAANRDDEYKGYRIPMGTIVMGSLWGILHNPEDYPEPEVFKPERYLTPDGKIDPSVRDPRTACFGFGRRVCPGRHVGEASLFAVIATLLATVNIVRARDGQGREIIPEVDVTSGILSHPKPFAWSVRARTRHAEDLVVSALAH